MKYSIEECRRYIKENAAKRSRAEIAKRLHIRTRDVCEICIDLGIDRKIWTEWHDNYLLDNWHKTDSRISETFGFNISTVKTHRRKLEKMDVLTFELANQVWKPTPNLSNKWKPL